MLTQTSETAIRALILITLMREEGPLTPRQIAEKLGTSPTYMAKITGLLVKANLLRSQRGATGGVMLAREPQTITLLSVIEACQGLLVGNYCEELSTHPEPVCSFHTAMKEAHFVLVGVLSKWTLAELSKRPGPSLSACTKELPCKMGMRMDEGVVLCTVNGRFPEVIAKVNGADKKARK